MLVYKLLSGLWIRNLNFSNALCSLVINEFKNLNKVISVLITLPENLRKISAS